MSIFSVNNLFCPSLTLSITTFIQVFTTAHAFFKYDMDDPLPKRRVLVYFKDPSALIHSEEAHR